MEPNEKLDEVIDIDDVTNEVLNDDDERTSSIGSGVPIVIGGAAVCMIFGAIAYDKLVKPAFGWVRNKVATTFFKKDIVDAECEEVPEGKPEATEEKKEPEETKEEPKEETK